MRPIFHKDLLSHVVIEKQSSKTNMSDYFDVLSSSSLYENINSRLSRVVCKVVAKDGLFVMQHFKTRCSAWVAGGMDRTGITNGKLIRSFLSIVVNQHTGRVTAPDLSQSRFVLS